VLIVMRPTATTDDVERVMQRLCRPGLVPRTLTRAGRRVVVVDDGGTGPPLDQIRRDPAVEDALRVTVPFKLASRQGHPADTVVRLAGEVEIGGRPVVLMAGPCSVESESILLETARAARASGAHVLRGGVFKPRTSPYSFQGLGRDGLRHLIRARELTGLPIVTEVMTPHEVGPVSEAADLLQVGARCMQNYDLLRELGRQPKPVLLKRGFANTIEELLLSAEYVLSQGHDQVVLCERGIRTFEVATRSTLDVAAVPLLHELTHLPVIVDPSHATGRASLVAACARAAVAAGADGIMVEIHPRPADALSDGRQARTLAEFAAMVPTLGLVADAIGRRLAPGIGFPRSVDCVTGAPVSGAP
jgi:3-deoxy-7-phosphoheptulonate synthase